MDTNLDFFRWRSVKTVEYEACLGLYQMYYTFLFIECGLVLLVIAQHTVGRNYISTQWMSNLYFELYLKPLLHSSSNFTNFLALLCVDLSQTNKLSVVNMH